VDLALNESLLASSMDLALVERESFLAKPDRLQIRCYRSFFSWPFLSGHECSEAHLSV
jgi:hypothetical protein